MLRTKRLFLIGLPGAGKSSIGRELAEKLGYVFVDTDKMIADQAGVDIGWLIDVEGEQGFQLRLQKIIELWAKQDNVVLAIGGGVLLTEQSCQCLEKNGTVILLNVSVDIQLTRLHNELHRPFLHNCDNREQLLQEMSAQQHDKYIQIATFEFNTDNKTVKEVVNGLRDELQAREL